MTDAIAPLRVYGSEVSYFTGKLEAYLRYKEIPGGQLADGRWMTDTTPIIGWLETQFPDPPVVPADPATHFLSLLVQDFADEWLWRPAMHYRWSYPDDRYVLGNRLGKELLGSRPIPQAARRTIFQQRQLGIFIRGDGNRHI